ncbi:PAAR domain-containing protein [Xanthomonas oryzae pv. oryzicola]|uniref:PAAR domain-containing protein n=1 Tax=Xanthomonas oryzae TaxID=347 RepID=UPI003D16D7A5
MPAPIRLGDPTTGDGRVISARLGNVATIDGKPVVVRGDRATCQRHHGIFAFVEADDSSTFDDLGIVLQGHRLACGCHALSTLGASFDVTPTAPHAGGVAVAASGLQQAGSAIGAGLLANALQRHDSTPPFSGRFELLDEASGQPVAGRRVRLSTPSGKQLDGVTDAQGMTDWLASDSDEPLMFQCLDADKNIGP